MIKPEQHPRAHTVLVHGLILGLGILVSACSKQDLTPEEHIQRAKDFSAHGKNKEALIELRNVLQQQPNHPQANWLMAETYLAVGNPYVAEAALKKAREGGVSSQLIKLSLAKSLFLQGKAKEAIETAAPSPEDSLELQLKLMAVQGESYMALGKVEEACGRYEAMRQLKGDSSDATLGLSRCAAARQNLPLSRQLTEQAIQLDPKNPEVWVQLGHIERGQNRLAEAENAYGKALEVAPDDVDALLGRAMARLKQSKFDAAKKDIEHARTVATSNPLPTHLLGVEAFLRRNYPEAKNRFQLVLKLAPDYLPSIFWQGVTDIYLGNAEQAVKGLGLYSARQPNDQMAKVILASAQARLGNKISAEENLKALRGLGLENPELLGMSGQAYLSLGKTAEAQRLLRMALESHPKDVGLKLALAESYRQQNQNDAFVKELREAGAMAPENMAIHARLAQAYAAQGKTAEAQGEIAAMRRLAPKSPEPLLLLAGMQLQKQDKAGARKTFQEMLALDPASATALMNLARLDLAEGKTASAKERFLAVHQRNKQDMTALMGLAGLAYAQNDLEGQRGWLEKAVKADPKAIPPLLQLTRNLLSTGKVQQALNVARQANSADSSNPATLAALGDVQFAAEDFDSARSTYTKLTESTPKSPEAFLKLAQACGKVGLKNDAKAALKQAAAVGPGFLAGRLALANQEASEGNYAEALRLADGIKKDFPKLSAGYLLAGEIQFADKKPTEARAQFEQGIRVQPTSILQVRLASTLHALGNAQAAAATLQQWLKAHPEDQSVRLELANLLLGQNKAEAGIAEYETMLKQNPNQPALLNDLAWHLQAQGASQRALAKAEQALKLAPGNAVIQDTLGWILVQQGQAKRGLEYLSKATEGAPKSPAVRYHYGAALARSGDKAKARAELETAVASKASFAERQEAESLLRSLQ